MQAPLFDDLPAGATISDLTPLPSDPNMRRIKVGKKSLATLRASDVEALGLHIGRPWTAALAQAVQHEAAATKARKQAMNLLGQRPLSKAELIERLIRKGHDRDVAQRIADELAADRWIDEAAYGEAIVHQATQRKPASYKLLIAKLQARKIEPALAERIARAALDSGNEFTAALEMARRRLGTMGDLPAVVAQRRLAAALERRGFDEEIINGVLERLHIGADQLQD